MPDRLFVYGTLSPGKEYHHIVKDIPGVWQPASLRGQLFEAGWGASMGCPGIIPSETGEPVDGFVLESDELFEHWSTLDDFEGEGYERVPVIVDLGNGSTVDAYVYRIILS